MTTSMLLGSMATRVAERITQTIGHQEQLTREEGAWAQAIDIAAGGPIGGRGETPHVRLPPQVVGKPRSSSAIELMWRQAGRIVFAMHPDLMTEIADTTSEQISGTVFTRLPYTNPLIIFPDAISATTGDGHPCRILGFYAYGTTAAPGHPDRRLCTTHDPQIRALGLMIVCEILDARGRVADVDITRVSVPVGGRFTVAEATEAMLAAYGLDLFTAGLHSTDAQRDWIATVTRLALNVLLYLCSRTPDLGETRTRPPKRKRAQGKTREATLEPSRMIKAGWRLGPALVRARARLADRSATPAATGRQQPPQHRRCHYKTVWTGTGRTVPDVAFVLPYWTHRDLLGIDADTTVVPVEPS